MRFSILILALVPQFAFAQASGPIATKYGAIAERIINAAIADNGASWNKLARFADYTGPRLSGSAALERGIDWMIAEMKKDGLDSVRGERTMVPKWVRGTESATLMRPRVAKLPMLGLGGSVGTPAAGITGDVMVVTSFEDLTARAAEARGKIVLFDVPFTSYGATVRYRSGGASAAAKVGAIAALVRSVTPYSMRTPHTGAMNYDSTVARKIPAAAITVEDAMMIHRMIDRGERVTVKLQMSAMKLPDSPSRNVVGELKGSSLPDEFVVFGGHIDSWDVGQGAMDDGGGVVIAWEAIRLLKKLGLTPRRTIRVVGWTNEENGGRGGQAYRDAHRAEADKHSLVIESDGGVFSPRGFGFTGSDSARKIVTQIGALFARIKADSVGATGGGADISPMMALGVPGAGLEVDGTKYFWFHHTDADTMDKLDPAEMQRCVAVMAVLAYIVADLPERLPRSRGAPRRRGAGGGVATPGLYPRSTQLLPGAPAPQRRFSPTLPRSSVSKIPSSMKNVATAASVSVSTDERWLVAQARGGDRGAARQLYDLHSRRIHRLVFRICEDEELARDLTQDAFIRAFDQLENFRGESAFGTWLHRIAVSVALNAMRKVRRLRDRERPIDDTIELHAAPEREADPDLKVRMAAAIDGLPESLRFSFVLYHVEGYTHGEIGEMMGVAEGTSKARVFEARARLREVLADFA